MKNPKFLVLFFILFFSTNIHSQSSNIFALVTEDTVTLWQTRAWRNCGAIYNMEIDQFNQTVRWYQVESNAFANCNCHFDLSVKCGSLEPGNYKVTVYIVDTFYEDTLFEGMTSFTIGNSSLGVEPTIISQFQSECYQTYGFEEGSDSRNNINIYPVPLRKGELLHFDAQINEMNLFLEIYNLSGEMIYRKQYNGNNQVWDQWSKEELFPVAGMYFVKLKTPDQIYIRKIVVL